MKHFLKLSALAAVLVASASYASASTINLNSAGGSSGFTNGTLEFLGYNSTPSTTIPGSLTYTTNLGVATTSTVNIGTGAGVWVGPLAGSNWVSFTNTAPGAAVASNGSYVYQTTFDTTGLGTGPWTGSMSILADDTVSVFLNGVSILTAQPVGANGHCSSGVPSCTDPAGTSFSLTGINANAVNTLVFVVQQTNLVAEGLDFSGSVSNPAVPEPSTLLMLGTGLMGSAGALFRRMRK